MAKSVEVMKSVGKFFGITQSQSDDWRHKAEGQIKDGEFGLSLKRSVSKQDSEQEKFVFSAKKMLSRISAIQTYEESQEHLSQLDQTDDNIHTSAELEEQQASCSEESHDQPLTLTTPKQTKSLGKQWTYNRLYTDSDSEDDDTESGQKTKHKSKIKVRFERERADESSENSTRSVNLFPQSEMTDNENLTERNVFSDPYVSFKLDSEKGFKGVTDTEQKTQRPNLIFFDELVRKPLQRSGFSDSEVDSLERSRLTVEKPDIGTETETGNTNVDAVREDELTVLKEVEKCRSSPVVCVNEVKENSKLSELQVEETTESDGSKTEKPCEEDRLVEDTNEHTEGASRSKDAAELNTKTEKKAEEKLKPEDVVYGKDALKHYKFYLKIEKRVSRNKLRAELERRLQEYDWKLAAIDELILLAKDYYVNPDTKNASRWKDLKREVKKSSSHQIGHTDTRRKLGTLSVYRPYFTYFIILAQLLSFIVVCWLNGFTYVGLEPRLTLESSIQTFIGKETVHKWTAPNIWIGPSEKDLIGVGGVFAPCMREDIGIQLEQSRQNYSTHTRLGCCEVASRNIAGTTTQVECEQLTEGIGKWRDDVTCNKRPVKEAGVRHRMKPCCLGVKGQCQLLSHKHCVFLGGRFYQFGPEHCSHVMCLENICTPGHLDTSKILPWQPDSPSQWWRILLSLLYHHGIIEVVFVIATEWILFTQIEWVSGWLRMLIIYTLSGTASLLTSAIFSPYQSHVGAIGTVCGMGGVVFVELVHFRRLVHRPLKELAKLLLAFILVLFAGTLPYLDFFGMLTGVIVGALSGIVFLPYITFGRWHQHLRIALVGVASFILFLIFYFLIQMFVTVQSVESCKWCKLLNCVPYTDKMCNTDLWQQF